MLRPVTPERLQERVADLERRIAEESDPLKALELRLDKLRHAAARDQQSLRELAKILDKWKPRYEKMLDQHRYDERLEELRWSIEELRISLFAQEVKTAWPVSMKRLEKRWQELGL